LDRHVVECRTSHRDIVPLFAAADLLVLPTYREGMPNVVLEAAAMGVPSIVCDVVGAKDSVVNGVTGLIVPPQSPSELAEKTVWLINHSAERCAMGEAGREFVAQNFDQEYVTDLVASEYRMLLEPAGTSRSLSAEEVARRTIEIALCVLFSVLSLPLCMAIAVMIWLTMGFPILFTQQRLGLHCRPFTIYKFRTMRAPKCQADEPDVSRVTRFGSFLRHTSLDELPQIWNVLRGEMSIVGPRPLLAQYRERYSQRQNLRHKVRPGITGLAQISGRNQLSWPERLELDVKYVESRSLWVDCKIVAKTFLQVFRASGIQAPEGQMPEFMGETGGRVQG